MRLELFLLTVQNIAKEAKEFSLVQFTYISLFLLNFILYSTQSGIFMKNFRQLLLDKSVEQISIIL